ncbi:MAG: metalloregulator ArsR/SmtB family transcription factor [Bacillota bacterium]
MTDLATMQADVLRGLAHPTRVRILEMLRRGELCVCEIMAGLELEQSNVSQHLAVLRKLGIITARKDGLKMMYNLRRPEVLTVVDTLRDMLRNQMKEAAAALQKNFSAL